MRVSSLHIHPIKGGSIIDVAQTRIDAEGLHYDRRWMLVDRNDRFVTQRELPALALLSGEPHDDGLTLAFDGRPIGTARFGPGRKDVTIWRDRVSVATTAPDIDGALSERLGTGVSLVAFDEHSHRATNPEWANDSTVGLADGYPILIATSASLRALNEAIEAKGGEGVPMQRFRPNIVIDGTAPWADDEWMTISIGDVTLEIVKPCIRCTVTTVDQDRGSVVNDEPLATLRGLRMSDDRRVAGVLFGWNAVPRTVGMVEVGASVEVLETRAAWSIRAALQPSA